MKDTHTLPWSLTLCLVLRRTSPVTLVCQSLIWYIKCQNFLDVLVPTVHPPWAPTWDGRSENTRVYNLQKKKQKKNNTDIFWNIMAQVLLHCFGEISHRSQFTKQSWLEKSYQTINTGSTGKCSMLRDNRHEVGITLRKHNLDDVMIQTSEKE